MSNPAWTHDEERKLAKYLVTRVCSKASGRSKNECLRNYPRDVYFIGNLRPVGRDTDTLSTQPSYLRELMSKLSPVAFGAEFRVQPENDEVEITVEVKWACYYRIFPTFSQQLQHQRQQVINSDEETESRDSAKVEGNSDSEISENHSIQSESPQESDTLINESEPSEENDYTAVVEEEQQEQTAEIESPEITESQQDRRHSRTPTDSLFIRFRKIPCLAKARLIFRCNTSGMWEVNADELQAALDLETERAQQEVLNDTEHIRTNRDPNKGIRVPETALASESSYSAFLQTLQANVVPQWQWEVRPEIRQSENTNEIIIFLELVNTSPMQESSPNTETFLFDTKMDFTFTKGQVFPFELHLAPKGFRYDRNLWGRGFNCAVERLDQTTKLPKKFTTTHVPIYHQMRYSTRTEPAASFEILAQDPIPTLETILTAMKDYRQIWEQTRNQYVNNDPQWEEEFAQEFDSDRQKFEEEITLFERGCDLIRGNSDVRFAFQLTNETFRRGNKPGWRLFQIVFLVSQIPGIAALSNTNSEDIAEREKVDIIYFPTGGGKTEAYLGTIIFHCFFDRLRGKTAGVTTWTRFPLRLLTLQQTQRVADVIGVAELVRQEQNDPRLNGTSIDGFAVGYFVGQGGSPNEITPPYREDNYDPVWSQANDPTTRQRWKRVVWCPSCRTTTVQVDFEPNNVRIIHRCTNTNCKFPNGIIPVYVVDNEIYRYLPSVIVGTIDKLATIGFQRKLSHVFGQVDGRCTVHGYYKGKCCQKDCQDPRRLRPGVPRGLSGPTMFIQDELHLLKEGLGTFDGHYETFVQRLRQEFGQTNPLKVIASSATIEAFARQVEHLYGRQQSQARIFPGPGPTLGQSFYARTENYPQRLFIGLIPHNKTIFNTILELIEYYHREVQQLQRIPTGSPNPYGGSLAPGASTYRSLLDFYSTSLIYFLANRELNSIRTDIEGDINPNLKQEGLLELNIPELTGSTSTDDVTRILERLERPALPDALPDSVLATSMVSHGVDVDRFNAMIFYGMPRQNAEYIQASSRVGRAHVGIVFNCLHPARERDQSHYSYFKKFHEFLGQLVEPVAINRWAKFSINRTLPGLFMGVLLQVIANSSGESNPNRYYMLDFVKRKISERSLSADGFVPFLENAYRVQTPVTIGETTFRNEIRQQVQWFLDYILGARSDIKYVSNALNPKPMRSLRDVDEVVEIELDSTGTQWAIRSVQR